MLYNYRRETHNNILQQVNSALTLDETRNQLINVGIHTEACMTRPETCGAAGGAISLWVNQIECPLPGGIVSTRAFGSSGSLIYCTIANIW